LASQIERLRGSPGSTSSADEAVRIKRLEDEIRARDLVIQLMYSSIITNSDSRKKEETEREAKRIEKEMEQRFNLQRQKLAQEFGLTQQELLEQRSGPGHRLIAPKPMAERSSVPSPPPTRSSRPRKTINRTLSSLPAVQKPVENGVDLILPPENASVDEGSAQNTKTGEEITISDPEQLIATDEDTDLEELFTE
jgi:hypothetical protein